MVTHTTSTEDDDTIPPEELEMALEEFTKQDTQGSPEQRIEALKKRIAYLYGQMSDLSMEGTAASFLAMAALTRDLNAAKEQLARLQANHEGRN